MEHIPGIYAITTVMEAGSIGLVLTCFPLMPLHSSATKTATTEIACVIYHPEPRTPCHGTFTEVPITAFGLRNLDRSLEKLDCSLDSNYREMKGHYQRPGMLCYLL
jgi:hypothetical protein